MNNKIKINSKTNIDLAKLIDSKLLIQANSGGGKSWLLRRILEQSHGKVQQIVLDPEGEFGTLREQFDYVLCGKGGDAPAEPRSAAMLAHKLLALGVSAIIDLYELHPQQRKHFVRLFLEAMVDAPKDLWHPTLVVLDEAHEYVPQDGASEAASAVIGMSAKGRKRGYGLILATQRISKLHKDAAAECNNKLIGRTGLDIDRKRAGEELGFTGKEQFLSLRTLQPGEFYAFGPAISDEVTKVTVGEVKTTHPKAGSRTLTKVVPPTAAIKKVLGQLADLPAEAEKEAKTVAELKQEIALSRRHKCQVVNQNPVKVERIEVPTVGKRTLEGLKIAESSLRKMAKTTKESVAVIESRLDKFSSEIQKVIHPIQITGRPIIPPKNMLMKPIDPTYRLPITKEDFAGENAVIEKDLGICAKKIYSFLHENSDRGFTKVQLSAVTGYSPKSGGFNNALAALNSRGLIEKRGELINLGPSAPEEGVIIPSEKYSVDLWFQKLDKCEREIFQIIWDYQNQDFSKEELASNTPSKYSPTSGGFNNALSHLNSIGLIQRSGGRIQLNQELLNL